jgi:hypothetical protein
MQTYCKKEKNSPVEGCFLIVRKERSIDFAAKLSAKVYKHANISALKKIWLYVKKITWV